jgi:hypothetical protein
MSRNRRKPASQVPPSTNSCSYLLTKTLEDFQQIIRDCLIAVANRIRSYRG